MTKNILLLLLVPVISFAETLPELSIHEMLTSYEPNLLGLSIDDDDKEFFLDFKISLKYPLFYQYSQNWCDNRFIKKCVPYIAFTGRFGQYIFDRESSPVISKRFNPKLFLRLVTDGRHPVQKNSFISTDSYIDIEYAHESNGQRVTSFKSWSSMADDFQSDNEERFYANDYISRGWDYWGITYKHVGFEDKFNFYFSYKNFIGGVFQGDIEEYFDWEGTREINSRKQINGLQFIAKFKPDDVFNQQWSSDYKLAVIFDTGTRDTFKYNTYKVESSIKLWGTPFMIWFKHGYSADFAQYFNKTNSFGFSLELTSFD